MLSIPVLFNIIAEKMFTPLAGEPYVDSSENVYFTHHFLVNSTIYLADIYIASKKEAENNYYVEAKTMSEKVSKRCFDCSVSQQIKCFGVEEVCQGISKSRRCLKK